MALKNPHRYDTLLRIRKRQEEAEALSVAEARRAVRAAEREREALGQEQRRALGRAGELAQARLDAGEVRRYYQFARYLARRAVAKDAQIHALEQETEKRRRRLEEALKRRRMAERLSARAMTAFLDHVRKEEQRSADEIASVRAAAQHRPEPRRGR